MSDACPRGSSVSWFGKRFTLGAKGGVLGWYTANTLQGYAQSTHHILTWALEVNSEFSVEANECVSETILSAVKELIL